MKWFSFFLCVSLCVQSIASMQCLEEVKAGTRLNEAPLVGLFAGNSWFGIKNEYSKAPSSGGQNKPTRIPIEARDQDSWDDSIKRLEEFKNSTLHFLNTSSNSNLVYTYIDGFEPALRATFFIKSFRGEFNILENLAEFFGPPNRGAFQVVTEEISERAKFPNTFGFNEFRDHLTNIGRLIVYETGTKNPWRMRKGDGTFVNFKSFETAINELSKHHTDYFYSQVDGYIKTLPETERPNFPSRKVFANLVSHVISQPEPSFAQRVRNAFRPGVKSVKNNIGGAGAAGLVLLGGTYLYDTLKKPKKLGCTNDLVSKNFMLFFQVKTGIAEYELARKTLSTCVGREELKKVCNELIQHQTNEAREKAWAIRGPASDEV